MAHIGVDLDHYRHCEQRELELAKDPSAMHEVFVENSSSETVVSHRGQQDQEGLADWLCSRCQRLREVLE